MQHFNPRTTPSSIMKNPPRHVTAAVMAEVKISAEGPPWGLLAFDGVTVPYDSDAFVFASTR